MGGGGPGGGGTNVGNMFIALKPVSERPGKVTADQVVNGLRRKLTSVPGATLFLQAQQDIQVGGRGSDAQYQYTLSDENLNELNTWAPQLLARMRAMPELRDASTDQQDQGLWPKPSSSIATPPRDSASLQQLSTRSSTTPSVSARCPPCTPASTSTSW